MREKSFGHIKTSNLDRIIRNARFSKIKRQIEGGKIADLGCGYGGDFLVFVSPKIEMGIGFDLEVTNRKLVDNIILTKTNLGGSLPLQDNSVDNVVSLATIEHIEDVKGYLSEAYRILKPGGKLSITTPSKYAKPILEFLAFKVNMISKEEIMDHKRYFDKIELANALVDVGFKREQIQISTFELGLNLFVKAGK